MKVSDSQSPKTDEDTGDIPGSLDRRKIGVYTLIMNQETVDLTSPASCLCFNLRRAARQVARDLDGALKPVGLSSTQFAILSVLKQAGPIAMAELARALGTDRTTLTRNLSLLERDGLVVFRPGKDKRSRLSTMTTSGEKSYRQALPLWDAFQQNKVDTLGRGAALELLSLLSEATD